MASRSAFFIPPPLPNRYGACWWALQGVIFDVFIALFELCPPLSPSTALPTVPDLCSHPMAIDERMWAARQEMLYGYHPPLGIVQCCLVAARWVYPRNDHWLGLQLVADDCESCNAHLGMTCKSRPSACSCRYQRGL